MIRFIILLHLFFASFSVSAELIVEADSPAIIGNKLSENIGIETLGGIFTPLLISGCDIPCETIQIFSTAEDNQDQITISLVRGNGQKVSSSHMLGRYMISKILPAPRGVPQIKVSLKAVGRNIVLFAEDVEGRSKVALSKLPN